MVERQGLQSARSEYLRTRRQETARLEREIADRFLQAERHRSELERTVTLSLEAGILSVQEDIQLEAQNRQQSLQQLRESLASDFPQLQAQLTAEGAERAA